jgi:uncharacterized membrane protein
VLTSEREIMTRNLKALGLALVAMLAMSAVVASAASAQATTAKFTAMDNTYPESFHGTNAAGQETFATEAGTFECASTFSGSVAAATQHFVVTPVYSGCKAFGPWNATVAMEGCTYTYQITTTLTNPHRYQAHVAVVCPPGKAIKVVAGTCEIAIPAQPGLTTVDLENNATTTSILIRPTVGPVAGGNPGIIYNVLVDGFGCPFTGLGTKTGGTYTSHSATPVSSTGGVHIS